MATITLAYVRVNGWLNPNYLDSVAQVNDKIIDNIPPLHQANVDKGETSWHVKVVDHDEHRKTMKHCPSVR